MSRHRSGHGPLVRHDRAGGRDVVRRQELLRVRGRSVAWVPPLLLLVAIAVADYHTIDRVRRPQESGPPETGGEDPEGGRLRS
ncbi:hypothetical protein [Streptomyces collinus]|uniref:hypothetical protein n=1 Tax=Streptomyces collinus TaxID=42684 RepID=UPI003F4DC7BA